MQCWTNNFNLLIWTDRLGFIHQIRLMEDLLRTDFITGKGLVNRGAWNQKRINHWDLLYLHHYLRIQLILVRLYNILHEIMVGIKCLTVNFPRVLFENLRTVFFHKSLSWPEYYFTLEGWSLVFLDLSHFFYMIIFGLLIDYQNGTRVRIAAVLSEWCCIKLGQNLNRQVTLPAKRINFLILWRVIFRFFSWVTFTISHRKSIVYPMLLLYYIFLLLLNCIRAGVNALNCQDFSWLDRRIKGNEFLTVSGWLRLGDTGVLSIGDFFASQKVILIIDDVVRLLQTCFIKRSWLKKL